RQQSYDAEGRDGAKHKGQFRALHFWRVNYTRDAQTIAAALAVVCFLSVFKTTRRAIHTSSIPTWSFKMASLLHRFRFAVNAGHLPRRVLDDARRLDGLLNRIGRRAELSRRSFADVVLLHNHVTLALLMSGDHARQLPDQQPRDGADKHQAGHERD